MFHNNCINIWDTGTKVENEYKEYIPHEPSRTPLTTGTSVIGIKYDGGVIIAADTLISYGSLARYQSVDRVFKINNEIILGVGGDYASFQNIKRFIRQKVIDDICVDGNCDMKAHSLYSWITQILYKNRSRNKSFGVDLIIGGMKDKLPFLGHIDPIGRAYENTAVATGIAKYMVLPYIRDNLQNRKKLTYKEANSLIHKSMEILYYRDCLAISKYKMAIINKKGTSITGPLMVNECWEIAPYVDGF